MPKQCELRGREEMVGSEDLRIVDHMLVGSLSILAIVSGSRFFPGCTKIATARHADT